jgi:hypothetical protein
MNRAPRVRGNGTGQQQRDKGASELRDTFGRHIYPVRHFVVNGTLGRFFIDTSPGLPGHRGIDQTWIFMMSW